MTVLSFITIPILDVAKLGLLNASVIRSQTRTDPRFGGVAIAVVGLLSGSALLSNPNGHIFTAEQRAAIGNVGLYPIRMGANAWLGKDAMHTAVTDGIPHKAYCFRGGDNIVGAIGGSIASGIARGQQRDFDGRNADILPQLQAACGERLIREMDHTVRAALTQTPLGTKQPSPYQGNNILTIIKCSYSRTDLNAAEEVLLCPYVEVRLHWVGLNPVKMHIFQQIHRAAPARNFASQRALRKAVFEAVLDSRGSEMASLVKANFGDPI